MNAVTLESLREVPADWQGISEVLTKRERRKTVLTGIPSVLFWHRWKRDASGTFKKGLRDIGITLRKTEAKQWECVLWLNRFNSGAVELLGFPLPVPSETIDEDQPF